jgi:hypothetical protein
MLITLKVDPGDALALHAKAPATESSSDLVKRARDLGLSLRPVHPNTSDPTLQPYFQVQVDDPEFVDHVLSELRSADAVKAAFTHPPGSSS